MPKLISICILFTTPRQQHINRALGENVMTATGNNNILALGAKSYELYNILTASDSENVVINGIAYHRHTETKVYIRYNELPNQSKNLHKTEMAAVANRTFKKALIAPCYDGSTNGDGKLLLTIYYDASNRNGTYYGDVYDIKTKIVKKESLATLFYQFDFSASFPFDISDIVKVNTMLSFSVTKRLVQLVY